MDESIAATARVINLLGDSALRTSAKDLVSLARSVAGASVVAGFNAPGTNVVAAATGLDLALEDTMARSTAVAVLRKAAADLEGAIGAEIAVVRDAAAVLVSLCCESQDEEMRTAAEAAEQHMEEDDDDVPAHHPDSKQMRILFRFIERAARIKKLENSTHRFMTLVPKLFALHDHDEIMGAVGALEEAVHALEYGGFTNSELLISAGKAAADVERKLDEYIIALRDPVATLVRKCQRHQDAEESMAAVLLADSEIAQRREQTQRCGTWWPFWSLHRHFDTIQEGIVVQHEQQVAADPDQRDGKSVILKFAMLSCIPLIKALGTVVKEKLKLFDHDECIIRASPIVM